MKTMSLLLALCELAAITFAQYPGCEELPETGVEIGEAVPIKPQNVPSGCNDFEVLVARGTSEPDYDQGGKFGVIVGDPVISNLTLVFPGARGYPVQYPASAALTSISTGYNDVISRLARQSLVCPDQQFALIGYSQGAAVMHEAASRLPSSILSKIVALAMFGDPQLKGGLSGALVPAFPTSLQSKLLENCADGDSVCDPNGQCFYPHLTYIRKEYIDRTVSFLVSKFNAA